MQFYNIWSKNLFNKFGRSKYAAYKKNIYLKNLIIKKLNYIHKYFIYNKIFECKLYNNLKNRKKLFKLLKRVKKYILLFLSLRSKKSKLKKVKNIFLFNKFRYKIINPLLKSFFFSIKKCFLNNSFISIRNHYKKLKLINFKCNKQWSYEFMPWFKWNQPSSKIKLKNFLINNNVRIRNNSKKIKVRNLNIFTDRTYKVISTNKPLKQNSNIKMKTIESYFYKLKIKIKQRKQRYSNFKPFFNKHKWSNFNKYKKY